MPWLVKATPYDQNVSSERTLYFSDIGFTTKPSDTPADTYWMRRLEAPLEARMSMFSDSFIGGRSQLTLGAITLANQDGGLDELADYDWGGRAVEVRWTDKERPGFSDFVVIVTGTAERFINGDEVTIELRDRQVDFDKPYQAAVFQGTGGIEGPAELKGRRKPRLLGRRNRFTPVLINQAKLIYAYGSGPSGGLWEARDGGMPLGLGADYPSYAALEAATVAPGEVATCDALSLLRLGDQLGSVLTISADGVVVSTNVVRTFADMLQYIVTEDAGFTAFAPSAVANMNALAPQQLGHWYDGSNEITIRAVLDALAQSPLAYYFINSTGLLEMGRFNGPSLTPDFIFTVNDIIQIEPLPTARRLKRQTMRYNHSDRPLTDAEVLGNVQGESRRLAMQEYESAEYESASVSSSALLAVEEFLDSAFILFTDAQAEAQRRVDLFGGLRKAFRVVIPLVNGLRVGHTVRLEHPRYGLSFGWNFVVLAVDPSAAAQTHTIEVWG